MTAGFAVLDTRDNHDIADCTTSVTLRLSPGVTTTTATSPFVWDRRGGDDTDADHQQRPSSTTLVVASPVSPPSVPPSLIALKMQ